MKYTDPTGHAVDSAVHDSNGGPVVMLSNEMFLHIQDDYYNLGVDWADLPSDVRNTYERYGTTGYTEPEGGASLQHGFKDPATVGASLFGGWRLGKLALQALGLACGDGDCGNEAQAVNRLVPDIGKKLDFMLGKATGNQHNIDRSTDMLKQLRSVGLADTSQTRGFLTNHLTQVLNDPTSIVKIQDNGRVVRESLLLGPRGGLKLESIWEGNKLITMFLRSGSQK